MKSNVYSFHIKYQYMSKEEQIVGILTVVTTMIIVF
jgi:hypothetical protein